MFVVKQAILDHCLVCCDFRSQIHEWAKSPKAAANRKACEDSCRVKEKLAAASSPSLPSDWGETVRNAIETCTRVGTIHFLDELLCADGSKPKYKRIGQAGIREAGPQKDIKDIDFDNMDMIRIPQGEPDTHIVDKWDVRCENKNHILYFDVYHCLDPKPWAAPKGFSRPLRKIPFKKPNFPKMKK
ncbi:MAG: hypothetical protein JRJ87_14010 [Deltaproteobacteria bacterium]|nr:hypothetical protein [Deltaproteobacteria bacterium]